jgi:DNA primase
MDAADLKEYIVKNDKIEYILESLNCHKINVNPKDIRCALPNHKNSSSVSVNKKTLSVTAYDDEINFNGDIFTLVMELKDFKFCDSVKYLHNVLNLEYKFDKNAIQQKEEKQDLTSIFVKAKKLSHSAPVSADMETLNIESEEYLFLPHIDWIREGILPFACEKFHIGYDIKSRRILIPHRLWCGEENDFVGLIGRTTIPNYDMLDIPKYMSMKKDTYVKTNNVYGLQENYQDIQKAGYTIVYEAEKSVLKRYSKLDRTATAICGHSVSPQQARILISLNVDIIIAMDRGIDLFTVRSLCEQFYGIRRVYYMFDTYDLILKDKESPADKEEKYFQHLFTYKKEYDENEHKAYLQELKEREENKCGKPVTK